MMRQVSARALAVLISVGLGLASAGPCDLYDAAGSPCVGAFSLLRALYQGYAGPLYYVRRASDNNTRAIPLLSPGGYANASVQEAFCAGTSCAVWRLVDQSPFNNDLTPAPPGGSARHVDNGVNASALPVTLPNGMRAYGALFSHGGNQGYRIDITNGVAVGNEAETVLMVTSGKYYNPDCCFDLFVHAALRAPLARVAPDFATPSPRARRAARPTGKGNPRLHHPLTPSFLSAPLPTPPIAQRQRRVKQPGHWRGQHGVRVLWQL
jgi:hypothetical protein